MTVPPTIALLGWVSLASEGSWRTPGLVRGWQSSACFGLFPLDGAWDVRASVPRDEVVEEGSDVAGVRSGACRAGWTECRATRSSEMATILHVSPAR